MVNIKVLHLTVPSHGHFVFIKTVSELDVRPIFIGLPTSSKVGLSNYAVANPLVLGYIECHWMYNGIKIQLIQLCTMIHLTLIPMSK